MTIVDRCKAEDIPAVCAVCRRMASGLGYSPRAGAPIIWVCDDIVCHQNARTVYHMKTEALNRAEKEAAQRAIDIAGPYLDAIGHTDLAQLTGPQMDEFLSRLLLAYEVELRRIIQEYGAPF